MRGSLDGPCAARSPSLAVRARGAATRIGIAVLRAAAQHEAVREVRQRGDVRLASGVEPGHAATGDTQRGYRSFSRIEAIEGPLARHLSASEHPGRSIAARAHDCKWHMADNFRGATPSSDPRGVSGPGAPSPRRTGSLLDRTRYRAHPRLYHGRRSSVRQRDCLMPDFPATAANPRHRRTAPPAIALNGPRLLQGQRQRPSATRSNSIRDLRGSAIAPHLLEPAPT